MINRPPYYLDNIEELIRRFLFCSSHLGSCSHRCGGTGFGGVLHLLPFQKMLCEKEKAKEGEGEEGRSRQKEQGW